MTKTFIDYAAAVPVLPGQVDAFRAFLADTQAGAKADHEAFLRRVGAHEERIWLQFAPDGSAMAVLHWRCEDLDRFLAWEPANDYERRLAASISDFHGIDFTEAPARNELRAEVPTPGTRSEGRYGFALPILPGQLDAWEALVREVVADPAPHQELHRLTGIAHEQVFLQRTLGGDAAIYLWHTDDAGAAFAATANPSTDWAARMLEWAGNVHGLVLDPRADLSVNELIAVHVLAAALTAS